jgi:hypothetical protein
MVVKWSTALRAVAPLLVVPLLLAHAQSLGPLNGDVRTLTALQALAPGQYQTVTLYGNVTLGDRGPPRTFIWQNTACSYADNVTQVSATGGGCWAMPINTNVNVQLFGAKGDGTTDDTSSIQTAINSLLNGGEVFFPARTYCVKTGPLTGTVKGLTLRGPNRDATIVSACGVDGALLALSGQHDLVKEMRFAGSAVPGTVNDTIALNAGCSECTTDDVYAQGGRYGINATGAYEVYILDTAVDSTYGQAFIYLNGTGGYVRKGKFDQAYPYATPVAGSIGASVPSWAGAHTYVAGQIVIANGYNLQATVGGTSGGGSPPAPPPYGTTVVDGGVHWSLVGKTGNSGILCDGCGFQLDIGQSDFSGDESMGFAAINSAHGIVLHENTFGSNVVENVLCSGCYGLQVLGNIFGGGLAIQGTAISLAFAGDDNIISHNYIIQGGPASGATGVYVDGNNVIVDGNICSVNTCVSVAAGIQHFRIVSNSCFSGFGASVTCVYIAAGASDHYTVAFNEGASTTSLFDGGTGTHKVIIDENNPSFNFPNPFP